MHLLMDPSKSETVLPRVVRAALKLFVEKGIDGTTTKDIAARARVSEGALYRHFKSKNALAWHIFSTHLNLFTEELQARVAEAASSRQKIAAYVDACFRAFEEDRELFTFLILSEHRELAKFPPTKAHPGTVAMDLAAAGQRSGELASLDPAAAASVLFGAVHRMALSRIYGAMTAELTSLSGEIGERLWRSLKR